MAFNVPVQSPLTQTQEQVLAKLGSLNSLLTIPFKTFSVKSKKEQISLLDYMTKIADSVLGSGYIDLLIIKFINELFDKNSEKLEKAIIKSLAASYDEKSITISQSKSNQQWLEENVQPELHIAFQILKALLVKKIICMIFGPKDRMAMPNLNGNYSNPYLPNNFDDLPPNQLLDNSSLADVMFTTVNTESNSFGDSELNIVKLKEQLEKGQITFTISCQDVKVNLPQSILADLDENIENNIAFFNGSTTGGNTVTYQNPANGFVALTSYINDETQRTNNEENKNAINKSWLRILLDKIINLLPLALMPILTIIVSRVNKNIENETGANPNYSAEFIIGLAVGLKNVFSDPDVFKSKSTFYRVMMNSIYAIALTIVLKRLIKEISKRIIKAIAKKKANDLARKFKRLQTRAKLIQQQAEEVEKKVIAARSLEILKPIFNYI